MSVSLQPHKPFLSYEQQINKLKNEKNLIIEDDAYAIKLLKKHSYFDLISGYKKPFKANKSKKYKINTSIEDIYRLYQFDNILRNLFLQNILKVEKHIKSMISYYFCQKYGEEQIHYLTSSNYNTALYQQDVVRLIEKLQRIEANPDNYPYILHQKRNYSNIPLWVMMKALTLGIVSKIYSLLMPQLQTIISKEFQHIKAGNLKNMLEVLTQIRNVCAHNERLFDYKNNKSIDDMYIHQELGIKTKNNLYIVGKKDLFATLIILKYLLDSEDFYKLVDEISSQIKELCSNTRNLDEKQIQKLMGFPNNWLDIKHCKLAKK